MCALARRTAGAVRDRHEFRLQWREPGDGVPEGCLHIFRLRRKKFEGNADVTARAAAWEGGESHLGNLAIRERDWIGLDAAISGDPHGNDKLAALPSERRQVAMVGQIEGRIVKI